MGEHCINCGLAAEDNKPGTFVFHTDSDSEDEEDDQNTGRPVWWCGTTWSPIPSDRPQLTAAAEEEEGLQSPIEQEQQPMARPQLRAAAEEEEGLPSPVEQEKQPMARPQLTA